MRKRDDAVADRIVRAARAASKGVDALAFGAPVAFTYNPLAYARALHEQFITKFVDGPREVLFVGMNPGPFGMAQTGVPFGEVNAVTTWMRLSGAVGKPPREHPKRPVLGLACARAEVSGARLWGAVAKQHPDPRTFFSQAFVLNYCPLLFLDAGGKNLTPDKLRASERAALVAVCDAQLAAVMGALAPRFVLGVGTWAAAQAARVIAARGSAANAGAAIVTGAVPHPSPASPQANRGWEALARNALVRLGAPALW
jgi:single-strand selective monofunctional uracil DNA glycosylase